VTRVKTTEAQAALAQLVRERAQAAAGNNTVISRAEAQALDPFLGRAAQAVRTDGGQGARVTVDALQARALADAAPVWAKANPPGGVGGALLSRAEVRKITQDDPALGALSQLAYLRASQASGSGDAASAVRSFFGSFDFTAHEETGQRPIHQPINGGTVIDARPIFPANRASVPAAVLAAYDVYGRAMAGDWATVTLQRTKLAGHEVYVIATGTDGDAGYLEVLDKKGTPLASARLHADTLLGWDEVFGRTRFSPQLVALDAPTNMEGYSEPETQLAAGQVPTGWPGDATLAQGQLHYDSASTRLTTLSLPGVEGQPRHELAAAAFEYLWERSLKYRVQGSDDPFLLGALREGTMVLGSFTRPDGKTYEIADWRDIDDGSFTLYFDRTAEGRLKLAIEQFNN
jgi:hypothetical protein